MQETQGMNRMTIFKCKTCGKLSFSAITECTPCIYCKGETETNDDQNLSKEWRKR
jgi:ribosomal protein L37E